MITRDELSVERAAWLHGAELAAQHAREYAWKTYGRIILASVCVAQAIRESNWGKSDAGGAKNLFGIKSNFTMFLAGKAVRRLTWEHRNGRDVREYAYFRKYKTLDECFKAYADNLCTNRAYAKALPIVAWGRSAQSLVSWTSSVGPKRHYQVLPRWQAYAHEIGQHWATDPAYTTDPEFGIIALVTGLQLTGYDQPLKPHA